MESIRHSFLAMGTPIGVNLAVADERRDEAEAAIAVIERKLGVFGRDGWAWGDGALAQFNRRLLRGEAARIPAEMQDLFRRAWEIRERSAGRYDPRIAELVRLWGFDRLEHLRSAPPEGDEIALCLAALRDAPPYDGGDYYGPAPGVAWDLGGIGKGHIVDVALEDLRQAGFTNTLIDAGGSVAARGHRGDRAWRVGIRDPRGAGSTLLATIDLDNEAVITHGDDQRWFEHAGRRYAHLLDPATGWPAQGLRSLTVVHADGARADAEGAALFVAGAEWPALAARLGLDQVFAVAEDGSMRITARLAGRVGMLSRAPVEVLG